ncbi:hypothetical protein SLS58_007999 [Diplodia intermedia]|uniref:BZIP domain-containing protein n=1 Tax=Diplodia intermedia TaxID=856260 RepID=A0ABR3TIT2_9PEZI
MVFMDGDAQILLPTASPDLILEFDACRTFDGGSADPIAFPDPFACFLDHLLPNPWETPSVGSSDDFAARLNDPTLPELPTSLDLTPPIPGFPFDDSPRRDSLFSYDFDEKQSITRSPGPDTTTTSPSTTTSPDPSTASTSRKPSTSDETSPRPLKPGRRRRRRRGAAAGADTKQTRTQRELSLAKNRAAAKKCREKKRDWTTELQERHGELLARNERLRGEVAGLSDAVFELKEMVLRHASCGFRPIDVGAR